MANTAINHDPVATFPGSSTNTAVVKWSGTSGNALLDSGVIIDGSNNVTGLNNVTATGYLHLTGDEKELRFYEGANYIAIAAPSGLGADYTFTLPLNDGAADEFLQTNGSGVLTWAAAAGTTINSNADNRVITGSGTANTLNGESTLTYTGTVLTVNAGGGTPQIQAETTATSGRAVAFQAKMAASSTDNSAGLDFIEGSGNGDAGNMAYHFIMTQRGGALTNSELALNSENVDGNSTAGTVLKIADGTGAVSMPLQPAFLATNVGVDANVTGAGGVATIDFNNEIFDQNSDFASDIFTAPVTGNYFFVAHVATSDSSTSGTSCVLQIVTTDVSHLTVSDVQKELDTNEDLMYLKISTFVDMDANDTCRIKLTVSGEASDITDIQQGTDRTHFSGYLVN